MKSRTNRRLQTLSVKAIKKYVSSFFKKAVSSGRNVMTSVRRMTCRKPRRTRR